MNHHVHHIHGETSPASGSEEFPPLLHRDVIMMWGWRHRSRMKPHDVWRNWDTELQLGGPWWSKRNLCLRTRVMQKSRHCYEPVWFVEMDGLRQIFYRFSFEVCSFWYKAAWVMRWFFFKQTTFKMILWSSSCLTLCNPMGCSPPGSSVYGNLQARTLEWAALPSSRGSSWPGDRTWVSCSSCPGRWVLTTEPPGKPTNEH